MGKDRNIVLYRRLFLIGVSIAGLYFLYRVRVVLLPFVFAFLLAYLLNPPVRRVEEKKIPRVLAILIVYLGVFGLLTLVIVRGVPQIIEEFNQLAMAIPEITAEVHGIITELEEGYHRFPEGIQEVIDERIRKVEAFLLNLVKAGADALISMISYLLSLFIAPVFAFYMLKDMDRIKESFTLTIPRRYRSDVLAISRDLDEIISGYFRCQLSVAAIVGVMTGFGMYIIGLDYAFILGLIAGVSDLIPYLGPVLSAIPAVSLALMKSKKTAVYALLVVLIVQQIESSIISPRMMGKSMGLHPLVVIFTIMAGGELYGFLGILLAVPVAASVKVILRYVYLKLVNEK